MSHSFKTISLFLFVTAIMLGCNKPDTSDTTAAVADSAATNTATIAAASSSNADANDLTNEKNKFGYALGAFLARQLGQVISQQSANLTESSAIKGINDVLTNQDLQMTDAEIQSTLQAAQEAAQQAAAEQGTATITTDLGLDKDKFGYALGAFLAGQLNQVLNQQGDNLTKGAAVNGINDVLAKQDIKMTDEEIESTLAAQQAAQQAEIEAQANANVAAGAAFLAANKAKDGWQETASGLQYKTVTEGSGASPTAEQTVRVHYKGTLTDGTQFDSSYERNQPAEFPLNGVISGWTEGLQLMKVGGTTEFAIPSDMAYGPQGRPGIPPNSVLLFTVELLEIK